MIFISKLTLKPAIIFMKQKEFNLVRFYELVYYKSKLI